MSSESCNKLMVLIALLGACLSLAQATSRPLEESSIQRRQDYEQCEAFEVHLALGDEPGSMRVAWRTIGTSCGSSVMYGPLPSQNKQNTTLQQRQVEGDSYSITEGSMCTAPAKKKKFHVVMHVAVMSSLQHDTQYWYRILGTNQDFFFQSPLSVGPQPDRPWSFIAFGDMGESAVRKHKSPSASATLAAMHEEMRRQPVDMVLHMGDLAYADGRHKAWDSFMSSIQPVASKVPYMIGIGNHEYGYEGPSNNDPSGVQQPYRPTWGNFAQESGGECGVQAARRFVMPSDPAAEDRPPFWYSYDYSSVHFTIISTEHDISPGSTQYRWLTQDLAAVDRCVTPWLVVGLHRPMYVANPHKDNRVVGDHLRSFIEHLLIEYKVDLTIAGHVHSYYRTCAVRDERCQQDGSGVTHFVVGTAGHSLSDIAGEQQTWLQGDVNEWGFMRFDVEQDVMHARFIGSKTGEVLDEVKLVTDMYTPDECDEMRRSRDARASALRQPAGETTSGSSVAAS